MAEVDDGGFSEMLNQVWASVADELRTALAVGWQQITPLLGGILASIASYVLGAIVEFIANLFDNHDDLVGRTDVILHLGGNDDIYFESLSGRQNATPTHVWSAQLGTLEFRGDGGKYDVKYHWRVW